MPPAKKKNWGRQDNSGHADGIRPDRRIRDAGGQHGHQLGGEHFGNADQGQEQGAETGEDNGKYLPSFGFPVLAR
jgi:hypothetical protein